MWQWGRHQIRAKKNNWNHLGINLNSQNLSIFLFLWEREKRKRKSLGVFGNFPGKSYPFLLLLQLPKLFKSLPPNLHFSETTEIRRQRERKKGEREISYFFPPMATGKSYFSRSKFRFLPGADGADRRGAACGDSIFELDESDLFNSPRSGASPERRRPVSAARISKRMSAKVVDAGDRSVAVAAAASLPVNVPDWSKILRNEYIENRRDSFDDDGDEADGGDEFEDGRFRVPPHEFLARTRIASFSVHEGIGRTLKGRDLSRVRDAIWQKTGFEDWIDESNAYDNKQFPREIFSEYSP